jgi:hypothetical protein
VIGSDVGTYLVGSKVTTPIEDCCEVGILKSLEKGRKGMVLINLQVSLQQSVTYRQTASGAAYNHSGKYQESSRRNETQKNKDGEHETRQVLSSS